MVAAAAPDLAVVKAEEWAWAGAWDAAVAWGSVRAKPRSTAGIAPTNEYLFPLGRCDRMYSRNE